MHLLLDFGNTALKWAIIYDINKVDNYLENHQFNDKGAIVYNTSKNLIKELQDQILFSARASNKFNLLQDIKKVYLVSVLSDKETDKYLVKLKKFFKDKIFIIETGNFLNAYKDKASLGTDRWLSIYAVYTQELKETQNKKNINFCVVSLGTACTMDFVLEGEHKGGFIVPGVGLSKSILHENTGQIDNYIDTAFEDLAGFGNDTRSAIDKGIVHMLVDFITLRNAAAEKNILINKYISGGGAYNLINFLDDKWQNKQSLVLLGILAFIKNNSA